MVGFSVYVCVCVVYVAFFARERRNICIMSGPYLRAAGLCTNFSVAGYANGVLRCTSCGWSASVPDNYAVIRSSGVESCWAVMNAIENLIFH